MDEYPAVIVATSQEAGKTYAEALGVENYRVVTTRKQSQGIRLRVLIITPGYFEQAERAYYQALEAFTGALMSSVSTAAPNG